MPGGCGGLVRGADEGFDGGGRDRIEGGAEEDRKGEPPEGRGAKKTPRGADDLAAWPGGTRWAVAGPAGGRVRREFPAGVSGLAGPIRAAQRKAGAICGRAPFSVAATAERSEYCAP